jgi:ABC-type protease/lipase transport system fused ATPase/permease subunit
VLTILLAVLFAICAGLGIWFALVSAMIKLHEKQEAGRGELEAQITARQMSRNAEKVRVIEEIRAGHSEKWAEYKKLSREDAELLLDERRQLVEAKR